MQTFDISYRPRGTLGDCQRCGFTRRLNDMRKEWSGLRVCDECYDPLPDTMREPRLGPEGLPRPDAAPEMPVVFVTTSVRPEDL